MRHYFGVNGLSVVLSGEDIINPCLPISAVVRDHMVFEFDEVCVNDSEFLGISE